MIKKISLFFLTLVTLEAESLSSLVTQRGGISNAIFLNPAKLQNNQNDSTLKVDFINSSLNLSDDSLNFLKELRSASSSSNKNKEISQLLKKNIGNTLSFSAYNFSSISQVQEDLSWSVGIVNTIDGYFITHTGFGSKGAMESFIEKYKALVTTVNVKQEQLTYGINIKAIEKTQSMYNFSITEMIDNSSFSSYFDNKNSQDEQAMGLDAGVVYALPKDDFHTQLSLSLLNIGNTSFKTIGVLPSSTNMGLSLAPYENTFVQIDYLDIFKHQENQHFEDTFRLYVSQDFLSNSLKINSGILQNALTFGVEYDYSVINIGLHSYKTKAYNGQKERKYELSLALSW